MAETDTFSGALQQEFVGIPAWVWGVGAGIVVGGYMYLNRDSGNTTQTVYSPEDFQGDPLDPTNSDWGLPEGPLGDFLRENPGYAGYPGVGLPNRGVPAPITNAQWGRLAADALLTSGGDPGLISGAFEKYFNRQWLNEAERAVIDQAKRLFGELPEGPIGYADKPPAAPALTAPQRVRAAYTYRTGLLVVWDNVPGAQQYLIFVNGAIQTTRAATAQHLISGLKPGTTYNITVTPRANSVNGPSTTVALTTKR